MKFLRKSPIGFWLALAATYALALNLVLAGSFCASAHDQGNDICHASGVYAPANDGGGPIGSPLLKCPICLATHFNATVLSSQPSVSFGASFFTAVEYVALTSFAGPASFSSHLARGPPAIA